MEQRSTAAAERQGRQLQFAGAALLQVPLADIHISPYQHREHFVEDKLRELAKSIARDGLIEPIVVRPNGTGYQLIAGERRWRAMALLGQPTILARLVEATDLQARRMCAAENLQREDLSAVELVAAIVELVDAELADDVAYTAAAPRPIERVAWLLGRLNSYESNKEKVQRGERAYTEESRRLTHKFMRQVGAIFAALPKPLEWRSFYVNDLPLVTALDPQVRKWAIANRLNKSQAKALQELKAKAPRAFERLGRGAAADGTILVDPAAVADWAPVAEPRPLGEVSAREMRDVARALLPTRLSPGLFSAESTEWYTPPEIIERTLRLFGSTIDLDPCSNSRVQPNVPAAYHYTAAEDGLTQEWYGRVYMNPPYGDVIDDWVAKLCAEYAAGRVPEAVALVPARTDTGWWRRLRDCTICFIHGRLRFSGQAAAAPFPSAVAYFGPDPAAFTAAFGDLGDIWIRWR